MKRSNYQEVKNLIHNELKISKEDIQEIIKQTVSDEVQKLITAGYIDRACHIIIQSKIKETFGRGIGSNFESNIRGQVAKEVGNWIASKLDITVTQSETPKKVNLAHVNDNVK